MKNENNIKQELKQISALVAQIEKVDLYSVPSSYFTNLSSQIAEKVKQGNKAYNVSSTVMPYQIPPGYFENLSVLIQKRIAFNTNHLNEIDEETALVAPFLNTLNKQNVYSVPPGFFEQKLRLNYNAVKREQKVISFRKRSNFFRLSAAAVVTTLLAIGLYVITGKDFQTSTAINNTRKQVKNLSKQEIVTFLKNNSSVENINASSQNEVEIKSSLRQISDEEIQQYLKETGEGDDI